MSSQNNINIIQTFSKIQNEGLNLFIKKNHDYGDSYKEYGLVGVLVRLGDKIKRMQTITNKGINLVNDETLRDTLIDLHNYSILAIMLCDENINDCNNEHKNLVTSRTNMSKSDEHKN